MIPHPDKIALIYTQAATCTPTKRGAERLLAWMFDRMGTPVNPKEITSALALDFAQWVTVPENTLRARYASLWIKDKSQAAAYKAICEAKGAELSPSEVWRRLSSADRSAIDDERKLQIRLRTLARLASRWVQRTRDDRYAARLEAMVPASASSYCGWIGMLWGKLIEQGYADCNPWWQARDWAKSKAELSSNPEGDGQVVRACRILAAQLGQATLITARNAWLLCAGALLGMSAKEISAARRSDLIPSGGESGELKLLVASRVFARDLVIGPAAASWLHRMEGILLRTTTVSNPPERARALLDSGAPLWPSLAKWGMGGEERPLTYVMDPRTVSRVFRQMGDSGLVKLQALRRLHEHALQTDRLASRRLMGAMQGRITQTEVGPMSTPEDDRLRLAAQASVADALGLVYV